LKRIGRDDIINKCTLTTKQSELNEINEELRPKIQRTHQISPYIEGSEIKKVIAKLSIAKLIISYQNKFSIKKNE
jgi:hypothetical protein